MSRQNSSRSDLVKGALTVLLLTMHSTGVAADSEEQPIVTRSGEVLAKGEAVRHGRAPALTELLERFTGPRGSGAVEDVARWVPRQVLEAPLKATERNAAERLLSPNHELPPPSLVIADGYDSDDNVDLFGLRVAPPSVNGDVGHDYVVQFAQGGWMYFHKIDGELEGGPFPGNVFFAGFGGPCESNPARDPIVLFDHFEDRWVFSYRTGLPIGHQCFAISQGSDPEGPYFLYDFVVSSGTANHDPRLGLWLDADPAGSEAPTHEGFSIYHLSTNEYAGSNFVGVNVTAFEREAMLSGEPATFLQVQSVADGVTPPRTTYGLQPVHLDGGEPVPAGACLFYAQVFDDEVWGAGSGADGYRFWRYCPIFDDPSETTFREVKFLATTEFDSELCGFSPDCIAQPGTTQRLAANSEGSAYRFSIRNIDGELHGVLAHTVDRGDDVASVRWVHLSLAEGLPGGTSTLLDTGTLDPPDTLHRWTPSITIDGSQNIVAVYSASDATDLSPSIHYSGRTVEDPPGSFGDELVCAAGGGSQLNSSAWGPIGSVSLDPEDDCSFWLVHQYVEKTGSLQWSTALCRVDVEETCNETQKTLELHIEGSCPGPIKVEVHNATPGGEVVLATAEEDGSFTLSQGACAGTTLDLEEPTVFRFLQVDENGDGEIDANAGPPVCGWHLQALDFTSCETSNVEHLD